MSISSPLLLVVALLVVVGLAVGVVLMARRRTRALSAAGISIPGRSRQVGRWLTVGGIAVLALALAGPFAKLPVGRQSGTVILAMDASNSMAATDVSPTRLAAAQAAAKAFVTAQPTNVDIGVVGFDEGAIATSLPTADHTATLRAIDNLKVSGGTSITTALLAALTAIVGKTVSIGQDGALPNLGYWGSATIVLFSDGEDQGANSAAGLQAAATLAQNAGIHVDTVGVGTAAGTTIKVDGYQVHTALHADTLTTIAQITSGAYHPASDAGQLNGIAASIDLRLKVADEQVPLAGAFIAAALLLLGLGSVLTVIRTGRLV